MRFWRILMHLSKANRGLLWTIISAGGSFLIENNNSEDPSTHIPLKLLPDLTSRGLAVPFPDDTVPKNHSLVVIPRELYLRLIPPAVYNSYLGEWLASISMEDSNNEAHTTTSLWQIARNHNINVRHTFPVLKELIRHTIINAQYLRKLYQEKLSTSEQQLLKILSIKSSAPSLEQLRNEWLHFRWSVDLLDMTDLLHKLQSQGLLFMTELGEETGGRRVVMPQDIAVIIRNNFTKDFKSPAVRRQTYFIKQPSLPIPESITTTHVTDDLISMLSYLFTEDVNLLGTDPNDPFSGRVHRKHWRRLAPDLKYRADDAIDYLNFLFHFARFEELIATRRDKPDPVEEKVQIVRDHHQLCIRMIAYWLCCIDKETKYHKYPLHRGKSKTTRLEQLLTAQWQGRQSLLTNLATIPLQRWIEIDPYIYTLTRQELISVDIDDTAKSRFAMDQIDEDLWHSLYSILDWIGIVKVESNPEGKTMFYLTQFGSNLLNPTKTGREHKLPPAESHFLVLANLEIILPPDIDPVIRFRLCQFAESRGNHHVLTRDSIRRGLDNGWTKESLKNFLLTFSRSTPPDNVNKFIEEVAGRHGHIVIRATKRMVETRDSWLMTEIKARRTIAQYIAEQESPRKAKITAGKDPRRLLILLRKAGYYPRWVS